MIPWSKTSYSFPCTRGLIVIGHFMGACTTGLASSCSRELTNTLKPVRIGLDEVFTGVEWRSEVMPVLSTFCCMFLGWAEWVTSAGEFDCTVQLDSS